MALKIFIKTNKDLLVQDYIKFCKENGIKRTIVEIVLLVVGGMGACVFVLARKAPYIPFVWLGGIIVAIVQNEIIFRNVKESAESIEVVEKIRTLLNVILGLMTVISSTQKFVCSMIIIMFINISSSVMTYGKRNKVFLWKEKYIRYEILCLLFYLCEIAAGILYKWVVPDSDKSIVLIIFVLIQMLIYMEILKWGTDAYRNSLYDKVKGEM